MRSLPFGQFAIMPMRLVLTYGGARGSVRLIRAKLINNDTKYKPSNLQQWGHVILSGSQNDAQLRT